MSFPLQLRHDVSTNWTSANPVLLSGEMGFDMDASRWKVGDGVHSWNALSYMAANQVVNGSTVSQLSFSNSNGVTFGVNNGTVTASVAPGGSSTFANSNGVTFGIAGSTVTASVQTNYQSSGAYLTTAMQSNASTAFAGTAGAITGGSITVNTAGVSVNLPAYLTTAQPPGAYITTAMLSNASTAFAGTGTSATNASVTLNTAGIAISVAAPAGGVALQGSGTYTQNTGTIQFSNSNGVTFGLSAGTMTASIAPGGGGAGTNGSIVGGSMTLNTSGLTINLPAYLTTADLSQNSSKYAGTSYAMTGGSVTLNTSGIAISLPAYLTTAALSQNSSNYAGTVSGATNCSVTVNTSGVSVALPAYLTTAALSQNTSNYAGINSAITGGSMTVNTSGVSINLPAYLTTAMLSNASTAFAGTGTSATNASVTLNTAGIAISVAAPAGGVALQGSGTYTQNTGTVQFSNSNGVTFGLTAGTMTASVATNYQSQGAYLTTADLSQNSSLYAGTGFTSTTTAGIAIAGTLNTQGLSVAFPVVLTTAALSQNSSLYAGTVTGATNCSITVNTSGVSVNVTAPAVQTVAGALGTLSYYENLPYLPSGTSSISASNSVIQVLPFILPMAVSASFIRMPVSMSFASTSVAGTTANSSFTQNMSYTVAAVIYTQGTGASSMSLMSSTSGLASFVFQTSVTMNANGSQYTAYTNVTYPALGGNANNYATNFAISNASLVASTGSMTLFTGPRYLDIPFNVSLSAGNYWLGIGGSTATASNAGPSLVGASLAPISFWAVSQTNLSVGMMGSVTNVSVQFQPGLGSFSTNAAQYSNAAIALTNVSSQVNGPKLYFQMIRRA